MGKVGVPPCSLFGLRRPNTGAYPVFGGVNGGLWEDSCQGVLPKTSAASVLVLTVSHIHPSPLQDTLQQYQVGLVHSPMGSLLLPRVPMHILLCMCTLRVESLFPPVLSKSCNPILLAFKVWFCRNTSSRCQTSRLGSLTWGSEPLL